MHCLCKHFHQTLALRGFPSLPDTLLENMADLFLSSGESQAGPRQNGTAPRPKPLRPGKKRLGSYPRLGTASTRYFRPVTFTLPFPSGAPPPPARSARGPGPLSAPLRPSARGGGRETGQGRLYPALLSRQRHPDRPAGPPNRPRPPRPPQSPGPTWPRRHRHRGNHGAWGRGGRDGGSRCCPGC